MHNEQVNLEIKSKSVVIFNLLKLMSSNAFSQVLSIIVVPLLSRLYTPEAFGILSLYMSIVGIISNVASFGYNNSIILAEDEEEAKIQLVISLGLTVLTAASSAVFFFLTWEFLIDLFNVPQFLSYWWFVALSIFVFGLINVLNQWSLRAKQYNQLSVRTILVAIVTSMGQLFFGLSGAATSAMLIITTFLGQLMVIVTLDFPNRWNLNLFSTIHLQQIRNGLIRYKKFPLYDTWSSLLNALSWQLPNFLLLLYFSPTIAGFYAMGHRLLRVPVGLIGRSLSQVYYQNAVEAHRVGKLHVLTDHIFRRIVIFALFPCILLTFIGQTLFTVVLGEQWSEAGVYTQILAPWTFFWFSATSLSTIFYILEMQDFMLRWNIVVLVSRFIFLALGGWLGNVYLTLALFAINGIITYGFLVLWVILKSGLTCRYAFGLLSKSIIFSTLVASPLFLSITLGATSTVQLLTAIAVTIVYYAISAYRDELISSVIISHALTYKIKMGF